MPGAVPRAAVAAAFRVFDTDGNGTISVDELKAILTRPVRGQPPTMPPTLTAAVRSGHRCPTSEKNTRFVSDPRCAEHAARPSVRARAADRQQYSGHDAAAVLFQSAQESDEAFEQAMFRKSARLQQRRQAGG